MSHNLKHRERLRNAEEIKKVLWKGRRISSPLCNLYFMPSNLGWRRFTVITSRRLGNSVARNRAKRVFREVLRLNKHRFIDGIDIIVRPRSKTKGSCRNIAYRDVEPGFLSLCKKAGILKSSPAP